MKKKIQINKYMHKNQQMQQFFKFITYGISYMFRHYTAILRERF
jgi:hypothetical protein